MEDLIHDEGEELHGDEEDVVPRLEREAAFRQAAPRDDLSPEELEKFVNERYKARAADLDVGRDVATSECALLQLPWLLARHAFCLYTPAGLPWKCTKMKLLVHVAWGSRSCCRGMQFQRYGS